MPMKPTICSIKIFLSLTYLLAFFFGCTSVGSLPQDPQDIKVLKSQPPNILVILTDDQGYHDVSYYGTSDLKTPNIDAIANDGMRFDNFYANCPVCSPTRAALLSGRYQDYVGVPGVIRTHARNSWGFLDPNALMLPQLLSQRGYHTALIGKWHLGLQSPNTPNERGFDFFHGWLGDMMDDYVEKRRHDINYMRRDYETIDPPGHATDLFTQWSVEYIHERSQQEAPFFLYLAYNAPHFPVQPPEDWLAKVRRRDPGLPDKRAKLVAFIEHLDHGIGQVMTALKESGQYDQTLIIFSSDNGGLLPDQANNGPYRDGKQSVYEGGLRVPTCVTWPGVISPGSSTDHRALSMDIFPTALEVAHAAVPAHIEGVSFLPVLLGKEVDHSNRPLFFTRREGGTRYSGLTIQAVRLGDWKLLQNSPFAPQELYNVTADPMEQHNLIASEVDIHKKLNALLMQHTQKGGAVPWQDPSR